ncbi:uncharacterized protein PODANS_0_790 [Podospora anserina S mat+]|uniref:Podospora anserina S mat+ genomic DNA chromosome 2, supercontig 1 n=1 Tax=Podospora anserina (strain S / ATCC MYA-4624 / DSM 980 / FGSC 10383) TaxID=515849 RepID=B2ABQ3_PODAN|nr:uncharacterized protein PODANS_0_790 [Podospora anserina S mat+]CAP60896.1 unnamed protein product [Podospora anserina S mat+]CDP24910.1 Putative protein of unknown function [Podospora anserina S mat+]
MASNYTPPRQAIPPTMPYNDGLIPNDNPHTLFPEVLAKHEPVYHRPSIVPSQMPPAYPHELAGYESGMPEKPGRPFWKKPVTWVALVALVIIAILAGLLGAMAIGAIKTAGNTSVSHEDAVSTNAAVTGSSNTALSSPTSPAIAPETTTGPDLTPTPTPTLATTTTTPTLSVPARTVDSPSGPVTMECPGVDRLNLDVSSPSRGELRFQRLCDVNYAFGDTNPGFGLVKDKIVASLTDCIKVCADKTGCVGVVFNDGPQCWLKHTLEAKKPDDGTEAAILIQR